MADGGALPADTPVPDEIEHSVLIEASAERVFAIVREPGWFINDGEYREHEVITSGPVTRVVDPVHGSFQLAIEAHEPPNLVAFRWLGGGLGEISDAPNNTVEFVIDPAGTSARNQVRLTVRERGFAKLGLDEPVRRSNYEENLRGWQQELDLAKRLAENGRGAASADGGGAAAADGDGATAADGGGAAAAGGKDAEASTADG